MLQLPTNLYTPQDRRTNRICCGIAIFGLVFVSFGLGFDNNTLVVMGGIFAAAAAMLAR